MRIKTIIQYNVNYIHETTLERLPNVGDSIFLDGAIYRVEERGWILITEDVEVFLILQEIEGNGEAPTGRYDFISRNR